MQKYKVGINHIEFWVSDLERSSHFYKNILELLGWRTLNDHAFATDSMEIYLVEKKEVKKSDSLGIRHICFQALEREQVDKVAHFLNQNGAKVIRGPLEQNYSPAYYTVDFYDPDGFIVEVAHTPNMKFTE
ncbi:VOC family protein [Xanthovirga aplysinae]|uniref:VOC family protein n=1 Tax=Xanthovirga aplysinae TaxID=2529853 RepID=UPI0012BBF15B|nr:VOC family protein [Xanthovirga aplysinae]MTI33557.1 hypothetical protein [Xanthovirga aplysinae]